jgi:hypothetical protein
VTNDDGVQGSVNGRAAREPGYLEFKTALLEFAAEPTQATLVRYLNASRALERPLPGSSAARRVGERPHRAALRSR